MAVTMVFDIETIPDVTLCRRLLGEEAEALEDQGVIDHILARRSSGSPSTFLPHHLHQIVAISVCVSTPEWVKVWSLGNTDTPESELIARFFEGVDRYTPTLVSWNGSGFDLPVLHYRALIHGVLSERYWETGESDPGFKWNNYLSRYHKRHIDVMDVLANYQSRAYAPMEDLALALGLPGKMGMHGSEVWGQYLSGNLENIRNYCETDVLNTYLIYLRFLVIQGRIDGVSYQREQERIQSYLASADREHFSHYLEHWHAD